MSALNKKAPSIFTHEGGVAKRINAEQQLMRSVMSCLLWEKEFYEDGQSIADRIYEAAKKVDPKFLAELAVEVRSNYNLRHVPLYLCSVLAEVGSGRFVGEAIANTIQRADELSELLAIHAARHKVTPDKLKPIISKQMKVGIGNAFKKFDAYRLQKYNRDGAIKLRDVLFLTHPKPKDETQDALWKLLIDNKLPAPDTWEVALSAGKDKKATWERLIKEGQLGYLALLRNLRNMDSAGVDKGLIREAILARGNGADRVLPFRFIAAARYAPWAEAWLDEAMLAGIKKLPPLKGTTLVLVDVSGSMDHPLSAKSDMRRIDAAAGLASIIQADNLRVFSFSDRLVEVPGRRGMAGVDAVIKSQRHNGTHLFDAVYEASQIKHDRIIVITDEQATGGFRRGYLQGTRDKLMDPVNRGYMINVASAQNGVGYGKWLHVDGFSENILRYIYEFENMEGE